MSVAGRDLRELRPAPALLGAAAGCAVLLARPLFPSALALGSLYGALAAVALRRTGTRCRSQALLPPVAVLAAGIGAVVATRALPGTPLPARGGLVAVVLGLLAAVAEEAFFREYLYVRLMRRGAAIAVTVSAVTFALVHVPAYGIAALPVDLGAGLVLSWQRWASGRWDVAAVTHAFANVLAMT